MDLSERSVQRAWEQQYRQRGRLWGGVRLDEHTRGLLEENPELKRVRWLDAGCGDGKGLVPLLWELEEDAPAIVALDGARSALLHARDAVRNVHGVRSLRRVHLLQSDVLRPGLDAAKFNVVRSVFLLGHLRAPARTKGLAILLSLLRPGGRIIGSEFGTGDFRAGKGHEVEPGTYRRGTGVETHYFTRDEVTDLVEQAGGRINRLRSQEYEVAYGGQRLPRQRWDFVATGPSSP